MAYESESQTYDAQDARLALKERPLRDRLVDLVTPAPAASAGSGGAEVFAYPSGVALARRPVGGTQKRLFDLSCAIAIILLAAPLLLILTLAAFVSSKGPILYGHRRIGFRGQEFMCLKFRTMVVDGDDVLADHLARNPAAAAEWAQNQKLRNDPRITPIGHFLRKTSLDELPQLINILRGEMSLIGPRPVVNDELVRYGARRTAYLSARPGLSGLWQVSGRSATTYERRTELDEIYVNSWSLWGDVKILLRTLPELLPSSRAF